MINLKDEKGFTIVELLIATAILSIIILISTAVMLNIGNLYYKGATISREQDDVHNIVSDISQQIELSDSQPKTQSFTFINDQGNPVTANVYCIGTVRYTAVVGYQIGTQVPEVLWRDKIPDNTCPTLKSVPWPDTNGYEMIAPGSMLTYFNISSSSPFDIQVSIAYGSSLAGSLLNLDTSNYNRTTCKGLSGDQYCATASLQEVVDQRL